MNKKISRNSNCLCGSLKKYKHCCGKDLEITQNRNENPRDLLARGNYALQSKNYLLAEEQFKRVLDTQPANVTAMYLYGLSMNFQNKPSKALKYVSNAIRGGLDDAAAFYQYGLLLLSLKRPEEAKIQLKKALEKKTDFVDAAFLLANILYEQFQFDEAEKLYLKVLTYSPAHWQALYNIARVYYHQLDYTNALKYLNECASLRLEDPQLYAQASALYEQLNNLEKAKDCAEKALVYDKYNFDATVTLAKCLRRENLWQQSLEKLEALKISGHSGDAQIRYWVELGKLYELKQNYSLAYDAFYRAKKELKIAQREYPSVNLLQVMERSKKIIKHPRFVDTLTKTDVLVNPDKRPVFIVGFFRSGTTLLEKMLSSHSEISTAGELDALVHIEQKMNISQFFNMSDDKKDKWILENKQAYYAEAEKKGLFSNDLSLFIDKQPFNIVRLPLIRLLFPNALIIRVLRHPLDIAISCFSIAFSNRNDWSYSLQDTINLLYSINTHYNDILNHGLDISPLQVRYEDLVQTPQSIITQILGRLDKNWEDNCMNYHKKTSHTYTASYDQVSKKLYSSSVGRYRNFLEHYNQETLCVTNQLISEQGYCI